MTEPADLTIPARLMSGAFLGALAMGDPQVCGHTQRGTVVAIHHTVDATLLDCTQEAVDPDGHVFTVKFAITLAPEVLVAVWQPAKPGPGWATDPPPPG